MSVITGVFVGLLPAITATRVAPHAALQENSRGSVGSALRHRARAALVVAEVALAVTLTIGAGLLLRSFVSLMSVNPGFEPAQMLTWQMNLPSRIYDAGATHRVLSRVPRAHAGAARRGERRRHQPPAARQHRAHDVDHGRRAADPVAEWPEVQFRRALGDYFQTMGIPIIKGRTFNDGDTPASAPVCMVNQTMAAQVVPGRGSGRPAVRNSQTGPPWTIIALIGDVKHGALDEEPQPEMYVSTNQGAMNSPYVVMRTTGNAASMIDLVRAEARQIDRDLPIYSIQPMEAVKSDSVAQRRFILVLVALFGVLALTLAAIGVYGVMSLLVSERTQEVGVRLALGAHPGAGPEDAGRAGARLALIGVALGVALSLVADAAAGDSALRRAAARPAHPGGRAVVLLVVAMLAALIPARRAMRVDPVQALSTNKIAASAFGARGTRGSPFA